jgi:hypothetical protein
VHTGRSATIFQNPKSERLLFPKAAIQIGRNWVKLGSAFGQERTLAGSKNGPELAAEDFIVFKQVR